jgi:tetratricopeptide (TPR) repeat protein
VRWPTAAWALAALPCSAPAPPADLTAAERHEKAGQADAALTAYLRAQTSCRTEREAYRRRMYCAQAHLGHAELLARLDRAEQAAAAYEAIATRLPDDPAAAAQGLLRAGELRLAAGQEVAAYRLLWRVVTEHPDEAFAADAVEVLLRDGRRRDAAQLEAELGRLADALRATQVADNLLYAIADLAEARGDRGAARAAYDALVAGHPRSGLVDEALWHGARLSRALGDGRGAAARLERLLASREVAFGAGSYFSVWLDDAQLELGVVRRDDLGDLPGALAAFARLPVDYPASTLVDDALWQTARTHAAAGDTARACAALARLARDHADSKYQLDLAPALARELRCR